MSSRTKLRQALRAIDDAKDHLNRAKQNVEDSTEIRRAIDELDDAENDIRRAIRELPDE